MHADDRGAPGEWSTTSPEHLDRLAQGVLWAARDAAKELRRNPPDSARQAWTLGILEGQTQTMLGPDLLDLPVEAEAQERFVHNALALAVHVRAHNWAEKDLGKKGVSGQADVPNAGERVTADAFDVLGRLMLPHSSPTGWTATLVTDLSRGNKTLEAAVSLGKYVLHPTFLAFVNDATRVVGEGLHGINVRRLQELRNALVQPPDRKARRLTTRCSSPSATSATYDSAAPPETWTLPEPPRTPGSVTLPRRQTSRRRHKPLPLPEVIESATQPDPQPDTQSSLPPLPPLPPPPSTYRPPETPGSPSAPRPRTG
ncbi:hypothetical protein [Streptomyces sp. NPDC097610]|uniref:hypothetical protein n=1 Tax=Streptomyces sp. NPDC097610 TaxID=3157227 RepID=UPI003320F33D